MDEDSLDFEILNFVGIENLDTSTMEKFASLSNCVINGQNRLLTYFIMETIMFISCQAARKVIKIQMVYFENIHGYIKYCSETGVDPLPKIRNKKEVYNVFKIYYNYMRARKDTNTRSRQAQTLNSFVNFIVRTYTTILYICIFTVSVITGKISVLILFYLIIFFLYFIKINSTFLNYLKNKKIEKIIELKLNYFYEKYLSRSALRNETNVYDNILKNEHRKDLIKEYTNAEVKNFSGENLFLMSLQLRLKITEFEEKNKSMIFWSSLVICSMIINITYFSALIQYYPYLSPNEKKFYLDAYNSIAKILGVSYQSTENCLASSLWPFILLFFLSSFDVYVIKLMRKLHKVLESQERIFEKLTYDDIVGQTKNLQNLGELENPELDSIASFEEREDISSVSSNEMLDEDGNLIHSDDENDEPVHKKIIKKLSIFQQQGESAYKLRLDKMQDSKSKRGSISKRLSLEQDLSPNSLSNGLSKSIPKSSSRRSISKKRNSLKEKFDSNLDNSFGEQGTYDEVELRTVSKISKFSMALTGIMKGIVNPLKTNLKKDKLEIELQQLARKENFGNLERNDDLYASNQLSTIKISKRCWDYSEFYNIHNEKDKITFLEFLNNKTNKKINDDNLTLNSDSDNSDNGAHKDENLIVDMNDGSKDHILSYYYKNMQKYNQIRTMKLFLELQLRIIASCFIMILLFKNTAIVIIFYFIYIAFFYINNRKETKDVQTLKITAIFLVVVTLYQYIALLLSQEILNRTKNVNQPIWAYAFEQLLGREPNPGQAYLSFFGITQDTPNILLLEILPMIIFQGTIFYFDFFLFKVAYQIESSTVQLKAHFIFMMPNTKMLVVNYKKWKSITYKVLQNFNTLVIVRINEIQIIAQLLINMVTDNAYWNMIRLIFLMVYFSMIGFRPLKDFRERRKRIIRVLVFLLLFIWVRVFIGKLSELLKATLSLYTSLLSEKGRLESMNSFLLTMQNSNIIDAIFPQGISRFFLVIELFMVEIIYGLYKNEKFLKKQESIIEKKVLKSNLIALAMAYDQNEKKLIGVIKGYQEKIQLTKDIEDINNRIQRWNNSVEKNRSTEPQKILTEKQRMKELKDMSKRCYLIFRKPRRSP